MVFQRDKGLKPESLETGLPPASSGEDVPRWLAAAGLAAGLTLFVALLRYALDLLGVVFVIILVGFAIRAVSDWLTEGESVSGWAVSALSTGLMGTVLVGLWLFNSSSNTPGDLRSSLPGPVQRTVSWLESHGWGQRVLLPGGSVPALARGGGSAGARDVPSPPPEAVDREAPAIPQPKMLPSLPAPRVEPPVARTEPPRSRSTGEAEAAPVVPAPISAPAAPSPAAPAPARASVTVTMTASFTSVVVGRAVRLTATVEGSGEVTPTGTVNFEVDQAVLGRVPLRNGTAVFSTLGLAIGDHAISAAYGGDAHHQEGRSPAVSISVTRR
jgi:hypothetical protein